MALANSATDVWEEFDIDKTIVIDDFETQVFGTYDFIDDKDYSITRMSDYAPITHTDGAGMMLPNAFGKRQKNMMIRLPFVKGLLGVFDYAKFIQVNNCSPVIKDIYGAEHDVIADDIQVIFTKSQFKLWKYYDNWQSYKDNYRKYNCTAGFTNIEEDRIENSTINYQMLQSLTDITDEEILEIASASINKLNNICSSVRDIQNAFGATIYNTNKTALQKAILLYPELLNDIYIRNRLKDIKDSLLKRYRSGKLQVYGKYTFILPDFYAACQYWFQHIEKPNGLLADGEVFCWLFRKSEKLDCLRSPHLYREHAVRNNIAFNGFGDRQKQIREWFQTDAIYTSSFDLISKVLQFDVDGDKSLVIGDKQFVEIAERNMKGIVPLYYNMKKALPSVLNNKTTYDGLVAAFTGGNIGMYSNSISKIWNNDVFISGTDAEKQEALDCIKCLCAQNNYVIDFAKTLYKPEFPEDIKSKITDFTKHNLPYFFLYAKDKEEFQVEPRNNSFVNKLYDIMPNPRITCKYVDEYGEQKRLSKPDYRLLMSNPDIINDIVSASNDDFNNTHPVIVKYKELVRKYSEIIHFQIPEDLNQDRNIIIKSQVRQNMIYKQIKKAIISELSVLGYSECDIADILVGYLYKNNSKRKDLLWICYGDILYENLQKNKKSYTKEIQCVDCGEWFEVWGADVETCRCDECRKEYRKRYYREAKRKQRQKLKCPQL